MQDLIQSKRLEFFHENCLNIPSLKSLKEEDFNFIHKETLNTQITFSKESEQFVVILPDGTFETLPYDTDKIYVLCSNS